MRPDVLPNDVARVASLLYESLGTPLNCALAVMLEQGDWDGISAVSVDPRDYTEDAWLKYALDSSGAGFLRKFAPLPTTRDRRKAAVDKWWLGERDCFRTNQRLESYLPSALLPELAVPGVSRILREIRQEIRRLVGDRPSALAEGRFGPGATYSDRGRNATVPDKMSSDPTLTTGAIWFLPQWVGNQWGACVAGRQGKLSFVPGNRFTTVPKTSTTDRAIASEPSINVFYQLALGRQLRRRIAASSGWDLDRAQEIHRQVACASSSTREFATLDLSNASDTVARNLVKLLLPHAWWDVLNDLRSKKTLINGQWVYLEKFSSMGNGFTFELETLIFSAISCVASREAGFKGRLGEDVFVFGDDIIVKDGAVENVVACLTFLGFSLNKEKSFWGGTPFRESCGGDYFAGKPVRPFFLKESLDGPSDIISLANGLRALFQRLDPYESGRHRSVWFSVLDLIPSGIRRCRGPQALGDIVIHDDQVHWNTRWSGGIRYLQAYVVKRTRKVAWYHFKPEVVLACATLGVGSGRWGVTPRDSVDSFGFDWVPFS